MALHFEATATYQALVYQKQPVSRKPSTWIRSSSTISTVMVLYHDFFSFFW